MEKENDRKSNPHKNVATNKMKLNSVDVEVEY